ncbi:MAG: hypothetical protein KDC03_23650, partial [Flavobacteriales bacterium]|nr:hypothetical protein [Flavobacteriales bacterium]
MCTVNDVIDSNCNCVGTPVDPDDNNACTIDTCDPLLGVIHTPVDPDDGDPCTLDSCDPVTGVSNVFQDADGDGTCDANDLCPGGPEPGSTCDDGNAGTINDVVDANCNCTGTPIGGGSEVLQLTLNTDDLGSETEWEVRRLSDNALSASGGPYADVPGGQQITETFPLSATAHRLIVTDAGFDGMPGGGYVLRDVNGQRIIDNEGNGGNFTGSSSMATGFGFDLPVGPVGVFPTWCDREDLVGNAVIRCESYGPVSAEFGVNDANSGYQWRFFDPNGSYMRYMFVSHANPSDPTKPAAPWRATYLRLQSMVTLPVPQGILLNVQVRARANGVNGNFGPVCRMIVDDGAAACPTTTLIQ